MNKQRPRDSEPVAAGAQGMGLQVHSMGHGAAGAQRAGAEAGQTQGVWLQNTSL